MVWSRVICLTALAYCSSFCSSRASFSFKRSSFSSIALWDSSRSVAIAACIHLTSRQVGAAAALRAVLEHMSRHVSG
ncbi:hypothetical protein BJ741DRAFT_625954 [Chytriomyces cf. hyalinus JEL632]|nr:hypothetical protein BJ741DRAFT_625954 [Chytriomyces cf. hyalinus JEL632]